VTSPPPASDLRTQLERARALLAAGDAESAMNAAAAVAEHDALAAEANALAAEAAERAGHLVLAARHWERVLADDVDHAVARLRLASLAPSSPERTPLTPAASATLVSPEGVRALRYKLLAEIGRGASATVYRARDESLGVDVALKLLHPHLAGAARSAARRRFFDEARTASRLRHPGVVAIYDLDEATRSIVMEFVPGGTLRSRIGRGPLPLAEAIPTARALLDALAYVHGEGVVHGDLKPSNLLLRAPGEVVMADFGIAHLGRGDEPGRPEAAGTPFYQAPEQLVGAPSSIATDLFSAGAVIWETLAGRPLRRASDLARAHEPPPAVPDLAAEADAVGELLERLLAPDPRERLPSAEVALKFL